MSLARFLRTDEQRVIAAHSYSPHFGRRRELAKGGTVILPEMDGSINTRSIAKIDTGDPCDVDCVGNSDFDLALCICTAGGKTGVTALYNRAEEDSTESVRRGRPCHFLQAGSGIRP